MPISPSPASTEQCQASTMPTTPSTEQVSLEGCQQEEAGHFSRLRRPGFVFPVLRIFQTLGREGIGMTLHKGSDYLARRLKRRTPIAPAARRPFSAEEVLNLQPGELVEVKSLEEIFATLDRRGKNRGLMFTPHMAAFAGRRLRVFKRIERMFLEESKQHRKVANTVLLEASYCNGAGFNCDRSCFLFWKEVWLRRVSSIEPPTVTPPVQGGPRLIQIQSLQRVDK